MSDRRIMLCCPAHGNLILSHAQLRAQLLYDELGWTCPVPGCERDVHCYNLPRALADDPRCALCKKPLLARTALWSDARMGWFCHAFCLASYLDQVRGSLAQEASSRPAAEEEEI